MLIIVITSITLITDHLKPYKLWESFSMGLALKKDRFKLFKWQLSIFEVINHYFEFKDNKPILTLKYKPIFSEYPII
jgi:hypothetical protein